MVGLMVNFKISTILHNFYIKVQKERNIRKRKKAELGREKYFRRWILRFLSRSLRFLVQNLFQQIHFKSFRNFLEKNRYLLKKKFWRFFKDALLIEMRKKRDRCHYIHETGIFLFNENFTQSAAVLTVKDRNIYLYQIKWKFLHDYLNFNDYLIINFLYWDRYHQ